MNAQKIPIIKKYTRSHMFKYYVQCPKKNREIKECECIPCEHLRIAESDFIKCNFMQDMQMADKTICPY